MTSTKDKVTKKLIRDEHYQYSGRFDTAQAFLDSMEMSMTRDCLEFAADLKDQKVCIIAGDKDQLTSTKTTRKLTRAIGTDLNLLDGTGHLIVYEQPTQVASIVRQFLQESKKKSIVHASRNLFVNCFELFKCMIDVVLSQDFMRTSNQLFAFYRIF